MATPVKCNVYFRQSQPEPNIGAYLLKGVEKGSGQHQTCHMQFGIPRAC